MPRKPDSLGITWIGPVLTGETSVQEELRYNELRARSYTGAPFSRTREIIPLGIHVRDLIKRGIE